MKKVLLILAVALMAGCLSSTDKAVQKEMDKINNQVALDAEAQYKIAKASGDPIDAYSAASYVAAAYLQAKDSVNYAKWKAIEKEEAKAVGLQN